MVGQEAVKHDNQEMFKVFPCARLKGTVRESLQRHALDFRLDGIVPVEGVVEILKDIMPDVAFRAFEDKSLSGLADNRQPVEFRVGAQTLQVIRQRSPADVHFIGQFVGVQGRIGPHELSENVVHAIARGVQKLVGFQQTGAHGLKAFGVVNVKRKFSLFAVNRGAVFQFRVQEADVVAYRSFADIQPGGQRGGGQRGRSAEQP